MKLLQLGNTNLTASKLGMGCASIASVSTAHPKSEIKKTLLQAYNQGINYFDTANIYGQGDSERLLGKLFQQHRHNLIICTKGGLTLGYSQALIRLVKPFVNPIIRRLKKAREKTIATRQKAEKFCFDNSYLKKSIEASLRRLRTDYIDLYLLHGTSTRVLEDEKVFAMLADMKKSGEIRYFGVSTANTQDALYCLQNLNLDCIQVPINLLRQDMIRQVLPLASKNGIGVIAREPFANGAVLSAPALIEIAKKRQEPPRQVALQYSLQLENSGVVLAGMTCCKNLDSNLKASCAAPLSNSEIKSLEHPGS